MATSSPTTPVPSATPSWEARIIALEQKVAPLIAGNTPRISTKVAGLLTTIVTGLTYFGSSGFLTPEQDAAVTVIVGGLTAYLTAEET